MLAAGGSSSSALQFRGGAVALPVNPADVPALEIKLGALVVLLSITLVFGFAPLCIVRGTGRCSINSDNYTDLCQQREAFIKEAADQMIEDLKKDLMARQKDLESPTEYEELSDDELPSRNWSKAQRQIKPLIAENKRLKEDNFKHPIEAMKELPAVGQNLRDISELLSLISSSASARSTLVQTPVRTPARSELQLSAPASPQVDSADLVSLVPGESKSPDRSSTLSGLQITQFTSETWQCSSTAGKRCLVIPNNPPPPPPHFPLVYTLIC
uniref:Uncharacterized protein n=1 Tax=Nothobranchius furzeri TaxID=105023 RepID=A0A1A8V2S6_NOTFU